MTCINMNYLKKLCQNDDIIIQAISDLLLHSQHPGTDQKFTELTQKGQETWNEEVIPAIKAAYQQAVYVQENQIQIATDLHGKTPNLEDTIEFTNKLSRATYFKYNPTNEDPINDIIHNFSSSRTYRALSQHGDKPAFRDKLNNILPRRMAHLVAPNPSNEEKMMSVI